jgi:hypothetical protein
MKKMLTTIAAILILACLPTALAFNSSTDQNCYHEESGGCNSLAWDEEYIYLANGWFVDEYDWWSTVFSVYRIDRQSGKTDILINSYPHEFTHIIPDGGKLYLLSDWRDTNESERYGLCVSVSEDKLHFSDAVFIDTDGEAVYGITIGEGIIYALTTKHVFMVPTETMQAKKIYSAKTKIKNDRYVCQPIIEDDWLYLLDGDMICRVNANGESQTLFSGFNDKMNKTYTHTNQYWYVVLNGKLYLWDSKEYCMLEIDVNTHERRKVSEDFYSFDQMTDGYANVCIIPHDDAVNCEQGEWDNWRLGKAALVENSRILLWKLDTLFTDNSGIEYNKTYCVHIGNGEIINDPDLYSMEIIDAADGSVKRNLTSTHALSRDDFSEQELKYNNDDAYTNDIDARHAAILASALLDANYKSGNEPPVPMSISYNEEKAVYTVELIIPDEDGYIWYVTLDEHGGRMIDMFHIESNVSITDQDDWDSEAG